MAIERGVDDVDVDELGIEDNTKEIQLAEGSEEDLMFDGMEDEEASGDSGEGETTKKRKRGKRPPWGKRQAMKKRHPAEDN